MNRTIAQIANPTVVTAKMAVMTFHAVEGSRRDETKVPSPGGGAAAGGAAGGAAGAAGSGAGCATVGGSGAGGSGAGGPEAGASDVG
ncbi:hypothetical protein GCM10009620_24470 [Microbacterium thalassium]